MNYWYLFPVFSVSYCSSSYIQCFDFRFLHSLFYVRCSLTLLFLVYLLSFPSIIIVIRKLFFMKCRIFNFLLIPNAFHINLCVLIFLKTSTFHTFSIYEILCAFLTLKASNYVSTVFSIVHVFDPFKDTLHTKLFISAPIPFVLTELAVKRFLFLFNACFVCAALDDLSRFFYRLKFYFPSK